MDILTDDNIELLIEKYLDVTVQIINQYNIKHENVHISKHSLQSALIEVKKDIDNMISRRNDSDFTAGKYAGVITYRLSKWNIVSICSDEQDYSIVSYIIAVAVSYKHLLNKDISKLKPHIRKELIYVFARRHMNQETLGICFDLIDSYSD
ncbi:MAG: hypothetical protein U9N59_14545 [Campylobacterota bacterium]|nr:hypothetical protein [Campylobacterota bacterium]